MSASPVPIVDARNLVKRYPKPGKKREEFLAVDGVSLAIQAGENPRMLGERLETFLPPSARGTADAGKDTSGAAEAAPAEEAAAA